MKSNQEIEYETLHSNKYRIYLLCGIVCVVVLMVTLVITTSRAKYRTTQSMPLMNGTINYAPYDYKAVAMYLDGKSIDTLPSGNFTLTSESYCTNEDNVKDESIQLSYDSTSSSLTITPMNKKGTKCYLYFKKKLLGSDIILANEGGTEVIKGKGTPDFSTVAATDEGMYASEDDWGTSYYYRGALQDNWVKFGTNSSGQPLYWRIIRINGDGTIRLIYNGTSTVQTGESTQIQESAFNSTYRDNMYVGYMYTSNELHGLTNNSTIKDALDTWYRQNLIDEADYIEGSTGFCGDRTAYSGSGTGTTTTDYAASNRLFTNKTPSLECLYEDDFGVNQDLYTLSGSRQGNHVLLYPIGLITADEVAMAGGVHMTDNQYYYLFTGQYYWTMSPAGYSGGAYEFLVNGSGGLYSWSVYAVDGVRPVINLKANVSLIGSGTKSDPYKVVGAS